MSQDKAPIFLARRAYSHRRLSDAARLIPFLGAGLFLLPLLWKAPQSPADGEGIRTVTVMLYLFVVWFFLAGLAGLISRRLASSEQDQSETQEGPVSRRGTQDS